MRYLTVYIRLLTRVFLALAIVTASQSAGKIRPATYELGQRDNGHIHAWIYFIHKNPVLAKGSDVAAVTEKALSRRTRRGLLPEEQTRQLDLPVSGAFIRQVRKTGATIRRTSRWLNAVSVRATREQLGSLAELPFVARIEPVRILTRPPLPTKGPLAAPGIMMKGPAAYLDYGPSLNQLTMLNVPEIHNRGYSGEGIIILMLDTGFYKDHEAIQPERILDEYDFLESDRETQNETTVEDQSGQHNHGTYTYTTLGGYSPGKLIGPAYRCGFLLAKTESQPDEYQAEEDNYVAGLEWGEALGADIVSSSLGYLDWYTYESLDGNTAVTTQAVLWATRLGMLVVTAAGNERNSPDTPQWGGYIIAPADADSIIAVGAVDHTGKIASFSSHGPTRDGRIKPEVVAQGVGVYCASPAETAAYTAVSGTSLSTPLVAGCAALLLEAHPNWRPEDVRSALMATASRMDRPDNDYGWGIPDVLAALNYNNGEPAAKYVLQMENVYPNPLQAGNGQQALIKWTMEYRSPVRTDIYNLLGQHVINLYFRHSKPAGAYSSTWAGIDAKGRRVPSGIYIVRVSTSQDKIIKRITVQQ